MNDTITRDEPDSFVAYTEPVKSVVFSNSGRYLATGHTDVTVRLWIEDHLHLEIDPRSHDEKIRPTEMVRSIAFSPDESRIFIAASDTINAYSTADGELLWQYRPPRHFGFLIVSPQSIAVSRDGQMAASFNYGSMARLDLDGNVIFRRSENYAPTKLGFSPQGKAIVGADSFNLCVWNAEDGSFAHRWPVKNKIYALAVAPNEPLVVTRELHTLSLWDIDEFAELCELPSGRGLPTVAFSPRDRLIASGERHRVRLINLECKGVRDLDAGDASVLNITFTPDGNQLVAGCSDGRVRRWSI